VARVEPYQRAGDIVFMIVLLGAAASVAQKRVGVAAFLGVIAIGVIIMRLLVEPAILRAAFPSTKLQRGAPSSPASGPHAKPAAQGADSAFLRHASTIKVSNPRKWWEGHQILTGPCAAVIIWLNWEARKLLHSDAMFYVLTLLCVALVCLRIYLIGSAKFSPEDLVRQVLRIEKWNTVLSLGIVAALYYSGALLLSLHAGLAAAMIGLGIGGTVSVFLIEPAIRRTAFGAGKEVPSYTDADDDAH
jgi:hypothetical protein